MHKDDAPITCACGFCGERKFLGTQADDLAAHNTRQTRPTANRKDDGDGEENLDGSPVSGQRSRKRDPEWNVRDADQHLDDALDDFIDYATVVTRNTAEERAQQEGEKH